MGLSLIAARLDLVQRQKKKNSLSYQAIKRRICALKRLPEHSQNTPWTLLKCFQNVSRMLPEHFQNPPKMLPVRLECSQNTLRTLSERSQNSLSRSSKNNTFNCKLCLPETGQAEDLIVLLPCYSFLYRLWRHKAQLDVGAGNNEQNESLFF